eukprot:COSAG06_NODE_58560_length_276_cov_1.717514_1_plen_44_part_10
MFGTKHVVSVSVNATIGDLKQAVHSPPTLTLTPTSNGGGPPPDA